MTEEIKILNRFLIDKVIGSVIKNIPRKKSPGPDDFSSKLYQIFKENQHTYEYRCKYPEQNIANKI